MKIYKTTDPILRAECKPVLKFDFELQTLIDGMIETMRKKHGIGLAAPQVGINKQIFVCEFAGDKENNLPEVPLTVFCNPRITWYSPENKLMVEGCLSFPGVEMVVKRPKKIKIEGKDRHGNPIELEADGIFSRVIQHENDHLNSTLLIDRAEKHRVIFIGSGDLGTESLAALHRDSQYEVALVVTGAEKTVTSRKQNPINPIYKMAKQLRLPIVRTASIRKDGALIDKIKHLKPDLGIMADFGQIIPEELLAIPKNGILNIHPSLLPLYRGPSPIQSAILNGDKETGVTIMLTDKNMDAGPIISQGKIKLSGQETTTILKDYCAKFGANLLLNTIPYYIAGDLPPQKQDEDRASYCQIIKKEEGEVDLNTSAEIVDRKIRAFNHWPKAWIRINEKRIQLIAGHFEEDGTFLLDLVKPEGREVMNYSDFVNGYKTEINFK